MLALDYTEEEIAIVGKQQRPASKLPVYFDAELNKTVPISRDFEAFLILYGKKIKQPTIAWLNKSANTASSSTDRDELIKEAVSYELIDAKEKYDEVQSQVSEFENFKAAFTDSKFKSVPEVALLLTNIQVGMDELTTRRDRVNHQTVIANLVNQSVTATGLVANTTQRETWLSVLGEY